MSGYPEGVMALYIKDPGVTALAREMARERHRTVTDVVREALEKDRQRSREEEEAREAELEAIQERFRKAWKGGGSEHDFLYDADGNPIR
jgi:hypothetical protein